MEFLNSNLPNMSSTKVHVHVVLSPSASTKKGVETTVDSMKIPMQ